MLEEKAISLGYRRVILQTRPIMTDAVGLYTKLGYEQIPNYPPYDKAGSYGIQDPGNNFHIDIKGDMDTILGFSMKEFYKLYAKKND